MILVFSGFKTTSPPLIKAVTGAIPLSINGFDILKYKGKRIAQFFNYCGVAFRGKEVEIIPQKDNLEFNLWLR